MVVCRYYGKSQGGAASFYIDHQSAQTKEEQCTAMKTEWGQLSCLWFRCLCYARVLGACSCATHARGDQIDRHLTCVEWRLQAPKRRDPAPHEPQVPPLPRARAHTRTARAGTRTTLPDAAVPARQGGVRSFRRRGLRGLRGRRRHAVPGPVVRPAVRPPQQGRQRQRLQVCSSRHMSNQRDYFLGFTRFTIPRNGGPLARPGQVGACFRAAKPPKST